MLEVGETQTLSLCLTTWYVSSLRLLQEEAHGMLALYFLLILTFFGAWQAGFVLAQNYGWGE